MTDQQLISSSLNGDSKAQRLLFDRYSDPLFLVSQRYTKNRMDAEDVLQESWIKIFRALDKYKEQGMLLAWMKKIVIHTALGKKRSAWFKKEKVGLENVAEPALQSKAVDKMSADEILSYVLNLPDGYKEIFTLFVIEGYSHKEIGKFLGIEASTSRAKLTMARKKMQESFLKANKIYSYVS